VGYDNPAELYKGLDDGDIHVFFFAKSGLKTKEEGGMFDSAKHKYFGKEVTGWANGVSFMCHPGFADLAAKLSMGLRSIKKNGKFTALCGKYAGKINCDTKESMFDTKKSIKRAEIIIAAEVDYSPYNNINSQTGLLEGIDIELTEKVCALAGVECAMLPAPWQSMMASDFKDLGWPTNPKTYPGVGFQNMWYHCSSGSFNIASRQQSLLFSDPYTPPAAAAFTGKKGKTMKADASDVKVGIVGGDATGSFFLAEQTKGTYKPISVKTYGSNKELFAGLAADQVDAVFFAKASSSAGNGFNSDTMEFLKVGAGEVDVLGWGFGVSYMCHSAKADVVEKLNAGLSLLKASAEWGVLCAKHPDVTCDTSSATFTNAITSAPDIVIASEADYSPYNNINPNTAVLEGFDVELTKEVCTMAGVKCALTTAPWQTMQAKDYKGLGWPKNSKTYPGLGFMNNYFDCSAGSFNMVSRQQSLIFSNPYADPSPAAVFTGKKGATMMADASDVKVGIVGGDATGSFFQAEVAKGTYKPTSVETYGSNTALFAGLAADEVQAVFFAKGSSIAGNGFDSTTMEFLTVGAGGSVDVLGWGFGVSYMCHPSKAHLVTKLNAGLDALKASDKWATLCAKYPTIKCDQAKTQFANWQGSEKADIVIGTEADYSPYNNINPVTGLLEGFDVGLTKEVCLAAGVTCAFMTAPWQSMMASNFPNLGWMKTNPKTYSGLGFQNSWFDCSSGSFNIIARQQSLLFSDPYTPPAAAAFIGKKGATMMADASDVKVGIVGGDATGSFFLAEVAKGTYKPKGGVVKYGNNKELFAGVASEEVHAVFFAKASSTAGNGFNSTTMEFLTVGAGGEVDVLGWGFGVSYMCHPSKAGVVAKLNDGLKKLKASDKWKTLCDKHPDVTCDTASATFTRKEASVKYYEAGPAPEPTAEPEAAAEPETTAAPTDGGNGGGGNGGAGGNGGTSAPSGTTKAADTDASDAWHVSSMSFASLLALLTLL